MYFVVITYLYIYICRWCRTVVGTIYLDHKLLASRSRGIFPAAKSGMGDELTPLGGTIFKTKEVWERRSGTLRAIYCNCHSFYPAYLLSTASAGFSYFEYSLLLLQRGRRGAQSHLPFKTRGPLMVLWRHDDGWYNYLNDSIINIIFYRPCIFYSR
jgi:hypothetical protein